MHQEITWPVEKTELYSKLTMQTESLIEGCSPISALANVAALLWEALADINWVGFYLMKGDVLYLGPFQGKVACTEIALGRGVCGTAASARRIQLVKDVHQFPGHIACDSASNSEIVVPMICDEQLIGVLDIDAPVFDRFDEADANGLECICEILAGKLNWKDGLL